MFAHSFIDPNVALLQQLSGYSARSGPLQSGGGWREVEGGGGGGRAEAGGGGWLGAEAAALRGAIKEAALSLGLDQVVGCSPR